MAIKMRDAANERLWRETLKRFVRSGPSVREFCRQENLAESAFYFWRGSLSRHCRAPRPLSTMHVEFYLACSAIYSLKASK